MGKQLFRSKENKMLAGVCGGIAEYFSIDPSIVRLIWVITCLGCGAGILAYIVAAIIMPEKNDNSWESSSTFNGGSTDNTGEYDSGTFKRDTGFSPETGRYDHGQGKLIIGICLILAGIVLLAKQLFHWLDLKYMMPLVLIIVGVAVIYKGRRGQV